MMCVYRYLSTVNKNIILKHLSLRQNNVVVAVKITNKTIKIHYYIRKKYIKITVQYPFVISDPKPKDAFVSGKCKVCSIDIT